jgi:hypothetical protein
MIINFSALLDEEIRYKYREKQPNAKFCHSVLNKKKTTTIKTTFKAVFSLKFHNKICILKRIVIKSWYYNYAFINIILSILFIIA